MDMVYINLCDLIMVVKENVEPLNISKYGSDY